MLCSKHLIEKKCTLHLNPGSIDTTKVVVLREGERCIAHCVLRTKIVIYIFLIRINRSLRCNCLLCNCLQKLKQ